MTSGIDDTEEVPVDAEQDLVRLTDELSRKHPGNPPGRVEALVRASAAALRRDARVTDFIPVLVINEVGAALRRSAA